MSTRISFSGVIVMIGCGCIGRTIVPLLQRHIQYRRLIVIAADADARDFALKHDASFIHAELKPLNLRLLLSSYVHAGDLILNLSVDVSSVDLIRFASSCKALYVDTSIEPWIDACLNPSPDLLERTNYAARNAVLALKKELGESAPTAIVDHGANPGLVSHFVKQAILELNKALTGREYIPQNREAWAYLARELNISTIQISERDTQASSNPKRPNEFVNTWSIDGFIDECMQPSEFSYGTHETNRPTSSRWHRQKSGTLYLPRPGCATYARSFTPTIGGYQGFLMSHDEVFSIADYLTISNCGDIQYRPTVTFVYHPCDDAMLSALEIEGRGWKRQDSERRIFDDIVTGMDELGVLLAGHARNAYWYGSQLSIEEARKHVFYSNATSIQVAAGALAAISWAIANPNCGILEPDEIDFQACLDVAIPFLGTITGMFSDWTPLQGRGNFYQEDLDRDNPWHIMNIFSRKWKI